MTEQSPENVQAIIDTATRAAEPTVTNGQLATFVVPAGGGVTTVDLERQLAPYRAHPRRKTGAFAVHDADSFVAYLDKHGKPCTEVWADVPGARVVAVVNAHGEEETGWADHRVSYAVQHTEAWKAWTAQDGKLLSQTAFAELIEDRAVDIVRPLAADMLELAQHFHASSTGSFESSKLLSSGERQFEYRETIDAKAGKAGRLEIPKDFDLALVPFEGAEAYKVTARFRYRISDGGLAIGYRLERPADVLREAFLGVVASIEELVHAPVFRGVSA